MCGNCSPSKRVLENIEEKAPVRICSQCDEEFKESKLISRCTHISEFRSATAARINKTKRTALESKGSGYDTIKQKKGFTALAELEWRFDGARPHPIKLAKQLERPIRKTDPRFEAVKTLSKSESQYLETLLDLNELVFDKLKATAELKFAPPSAVLCMGIVEQFITIHSKLRNDLDQILLAWNSGSTIGPAFETILSFFGLYHKYASHWQDSLIFFRSPAILPVLKRIFQDPKCEGKSLDNLLQIPFHRIPIYANELKSIQKSTPETHSDFASIERCIDSVSEIALRISDLLVEQENKSKILNIESMFLAGVQIMSAGRKFVREGALFLSNKRGELLRRHIHLFNDLILCSEILNYGYKLKVALPFNKLISVKKTSEEHAYEHGIALQTRDISYVLCAESAFAQESWYSELLESLFKYKETMMVSCVCFVC